MNRKEIIETILRIPFVVSLVIVHTVISDKLNIIVWSAEWWGFLISFIILAVSMKKN